METISLWISSFLLFLSTMFGPTLPPSLPTKSDVVLNTPFANATVQSPLIITGKINSGYMFEAQFPILVLDANRQPISQGVGRPTSPDQWTSGQVIDFTSTINFTTRSQTGFIQLKNDNPSGLPENDKILLEIPVKFVPSNYLCPTTPWVDCMPGPHKPYNPQCSSDFLSWAKANCPSFSGAAL
jgi:hypothetical protein